jgi:O-antigen ligase
MTARPRSAPYIPASIIVGAAMFAALVAGRLLAEGQIQMALAIVLAACYVPLVFVNFPLALALFAGMAYINHLSELSIAPNAIAILLVVGWLAGGVAPSRSARLAVLVQHRRLLIGIVLFTLWLGLSRIWTEDPGLTDIEVLYWTAPLGFVIVAMTVNSMRYVQIIAIALVAGAVLSVLIGLFGGSLASSGASASTVAEGRFTGGGGDPNEQAAGYVAAIFLAGGLLSVARGPGARVALLATMALVTFGFFATQSRGGLLAAAFAAVFALIVMPRYRGRILALMAATGAGLTVFLLSNPHVLDRLTQADGGAGREDLWTVAWRVFLDHPVLGTGLNSFTSISPRYVLEPGPLQYVQLIAESPHVVHNAYLQLLAENGIVGLGLFVFIVVASLGSSWLAARRFDASGQPRHADIARAVMTGSVGFLAAIFFVSSWGDFRLWILLALGPVMLTIARSSAGGSQPPGGVHPPPLDRPAQVVPRAFP